eukprot:182534_1
MNYNYLIKSREPVSFIPIDIFNNISDNNLNNLYLTTKVNNGEIFASIIEQAKNQKLTHLAIPITSKLLNNLNNDKHIYLNKLNNTRDMGFILNTLRLKFTSNNVAKNKRI